MLHFFKVSELTETLRVADRFGSQLEGIRDQVTSKLNEFMRRRLDFEAGLQEFFDTPGLRYGAAYNLWLDKKNVTNLVMALSYGRDWDNYPFDDTTRFSLDAARGKLTLYGPFRNWQRSLRINYDGGYPALEDDATTMACPEGLRFAALQQAIFDGRRAFSMDQGTMEDDKKTPVKLKYNGLLEETAAAFISYKKPLGQ